MPSILQIIYLLECQEETTGETEELFLTHLNQS